MEFGYVVQAVIKLQRYSRRRQSATPLMHDVHMTGTTMSTRFGRFRHVVSPTYKQKLVIQSKALWPLLRGGAQAEVKTLSGRHV
jgi:hypothetical protein